MEWREIHAIIRLTTSGGLRDMMAGVEQFHTDKSKGDNSQFVFGDLYEDGRGIWRGLTRLNQSMPTIFKFKFSKDIA